jgi:hypothetical protein
MPPATDADHFCAIGEATTDEDETYLIALRREFEANLRRIFFIAPSGAEKTRRLVAGDAMMAGDASDVLLELLGGGCAVLGERLS